MNPFGVESHDISKARLGPFEVTSHTRRATNNRLKVSNVERRLGTQQRNAAVGTKIRTGALKAVGDAKSAAKKIPGITLGEIGHAAGKPAVKAGEAIARHPNISGAGVMGAGIAGAGYGAFKIGQHMESKRTNQ